MVQDLGGGRALEVFSGVQKTSILVYSLRWSPDGTELLLSGEGSESYIIPRFGGNSRRLPGGTISCWSPDGLHIASLRQGKKRVFFTNKATGDTSSISLAGDFELIAGIDWSPNGDRLLVVTSTAGKDTRYTIFSIKTDGSSQQEILNETHTLYLPKWSVQGSAIYYFKPIGQTMDLLKIQIDIGTGKASGSPKLLQTGLQAGVWSFSLSKDNRRLLHTRELSFSNLWSVSLQGTGGPQKLQTKQLTKGTSVVANPAISPDGKRVAFHIGSYELEHSDIFIMAIDGGERQQLTFFDSFNAYAAWSPDSKEIVFGSTEGGKSRVWSVQADGGTPRPFINTELNLVVGPWSPLSWTPGSNILYQSGGNRQLKILNPSTEQELPLVPNDSLGWMFGSRYSPDGKTVAITWNSPGPNNNGIWLISLEDFSQTLLYKGHLQPIQWSPDGQWLYSWNRFENTARIYRIPVSGGVSETIMTLPFDNIDTISMTPDGNRIVCSVYETHSDVWLMENFDPQVK